MKRLQQTGAAQHAEEPDGASVATFIPLAIRRHGKKKIVVIGDLTDDASYTQRAADAALVRALARGLYWQQLIDAGKVASLTEIAARERLDKPRVTKLLRLARLAPDLVAMIWRGEQPVGLTLERLLRRPLPCDWAAQRAWVAGLARSSNARSPECESNRPAKTPSNRAFRALSDQRRIENREEPAP